MENAMTRRIINLARISSFFATMILSQIGGSQVSIDVHMNTIVNPVTLYGAVASSECNTPCQ